MDGFPPLITEERAKELRSSRGSVYGDPKENHSLIAGQWAAILQPWANHIAQGKPLPPHVVALCMVGLKLNRMRLAYHADNYEDMAIYAMMAKKWQAEYEADADALPSLVRSDDHGFNDEPTTEDEEDQGPNVYNWFRFRLKKGME